MTIVVIVQYIQHDYDVNLFLQPTAIDDWQSRVDTAEVIVTQWLSLLSSQWLSSNNSPIVCSILCKLNHWMIELVEANLGNHHQGLDQNKDLCSSFWTHYVCCFVPLLIHWDRRVQGWWRGESLSWSCRCTEPCPGGPATPVCRHWRMWGLWTCWCGLWRRCGDLIVLMVDGESKTEYPKTILSAPSRSMAWKTTSDGPNSPACTDRCTWTWWSLTSPWLLAPPWRWQ